jgi:hypothetical protein
VASSFKGSAASSVVNTSPMDQLRPAAIPSTSSQTVQNVVEVIDSDVVSCCIIYGNKSDKKWRCFKCACRSCDDNLILAAVIYS